MALSTDALAPLVHEIAARADEVDREGSFPRANVDALSRAGVLGLASATEVGGAGLGLRDAAAVIESIAGACGSTAMVLLMHYAATAVLEAHGADATRRAIAAGEHLSTLAFSEAGSRSHFWAPLGTAVRDGDGVRLEAHKGWVTAAGDADSYVWSSRALDGSDTMTLWSVPRSTAGLSIAGAFDGLGLRGNGSTPVRAEDVAIGADAMLGDDGHGLEIALATALPWFLVLSGAFSIGLMEAAVARTSAHITGARFEHLDQSLAEQPVTRRDFARMRLALDGAHALLADTLTALESSREDAMLRVLEIKAANGEAATFVVDLAMRICGGAAFRKEVGLERVFRDAQAARVMAPTTDALLDFIGRSCTGLPLLG